MDAIETETVQQDGQTFRITLYPDDDAPNPLDDCDEMGSILSLNHRNHNYDPDGTEEAIQSNPDAVPLSYFEHGLCRWSVAGELPSGCRCPFDSVNLAGLWLPDALTLESARNYGGWTRRQFMRKRARQACAAYTDWCNGEIYGYEVHRIEDCGGCHAERLELLESCWGFYGLEQCRSDAKAAILAYMPRCCIVA